MRKISRIIMAVVLVMNFPQANADQYMDGATEAVAEQKRCMDVLASKMVKDDYLQMTQRMFSKAQNIEMLGNRVAQFQSKANSIAERFNSMAVGNQVEAQAIEAMVKELRTEYRELVRMRYDLSWQIVESKALVSNLVPMIRQISDEASMMCKAGQNKFNSSISIPAARTPPDRQYSWMVYLAMQDNSGEGGESASGSYESSDGFGQNKTDKTLKDGLGASLAVAGLSGQISSAMAAKSTFIGMSSSGWMVTAGYALAAAAVIAIVMDIRAQEKMYKEMTKWAKAEAYKFRETKRSDYLSAKYKELCSSGTDELNRVALALERAAADKRPLSLRTNEINNRLLEFAPLEEKAKLSLVPKCRVDLHRLYTSGVCKNKEVCIINGEGVEAVGGMCKLSIKSGVIESVDADNKTLAEIDADPEFAKNLTSYTELKLIQSLVINSDATTSILNQVTTESLAINQERAFGRLLKLISQMRIHQSGPVLSALEKELGIEKEIAVVDKQIREALALAIRSTFDGSDVSGIITDLSNTQKSISDLISKYGSISALVDSRSRIIGIVEVLSEP